MFSAGPCLSTAADLGDQVNLAIGVERRQIGVLVDLAVDRHGHPLLDLMAEAGIAALKLDDEAAEIGRLNIELGQPAGESAGCLARDDNVRQGLPTVLVDGRA